MFHFNISEEGKQQKINYIAKLNDNKTKVVITVNLSPEQAASWDCKMFKPAEGDVRWKSKQVRKDGSVILRGTIPRVKANL